MGYREGALTEVVVGRLTLEDLRRGQACKELAGNRKAGREDSMCKVLGGRK